MDFYNRLGTVCKRYGPGRLPNADHHDIGAGYALASTALAIAIVWACVGIMSVEGGPIDFEWGSLGILGLFAAPLVVPTAFVSAVFVWRILPENTPYFGAVGGVLAVAGTYVLSTLVLFALNAFVAAVDGRLGQISESALFIGFVGVFALLLTFWVTFPLGCVAGIVYERINN